MSTTTTSTSSSSTTTTNDYPSTEEPLFTPPNDLANILICLSQYLDAELASTASDYALLAAMNTQAANKYTRIETQAQRLVNALHSINSMHESLKPWLQSIDTLDSQLNQLEQVTQELDEYSIALHEQYRMLYK